MKVAEVRSKENKELEFDLGNLRRELFNLRFQSTAEPLANPMRIRSIRRDIARIETVLVERKLGIRGQVTR
jgi:large subunit ribosomal protein L29